MNNGYRTFLRAFGAAVRSRREALQLTQPLLAERTTLLDQASLSRIERGMQGFSSESLFQLSQALDLHVCHLFGGVESGEGRISPEGAAIGQAWDAMTPDERKLFHAAMTLANANLSKTAVKATGKEQTLLSSKRGAVNNNTNHQRRVQDEADSRMQALKDEYGPEQIAQSRRNIEGSVSKQANAPKRPRKARAPR